MGLILDSTVLIGAERGGVGIPQMLREVRDRHGEVEVGVSVVTIAELVHGAFRAGSSVVQQRRLSFIDRVCSEVPVHPVSLQIARIIGQIEGEQAAQGIRFAFEDLAIGATALHLGYGIATRNVRHFRPIPGLTVVEL